MLNIRNSKMTGDSCCSDTKLFYSDLTFHWSPMQTRGERKTLLRFINVHLFCSHPTTLSLTDSYQHLTPTSLFGFQNSTALILKLPYFYISSILIICCIILSWIITCITNPYFHTPVNKHWFIYYQYPVFSILTWGVKPGHHLCMHLSFIRNYTYIQSP